MLSEVATTAPLTRKRGRISALSADTCCSDEIRAGSRANELDGTPTCLVKGCPVGGFSTVSSADPSYARVMTTSSIPDSNGATKQAAPSLAFARDGTEDRAIGFTLNGIQHELARATVSARLTETTPEVILKHAVRVNATWFPVMQAFETATGIPRADFKSRAARRHLATLGYEIRGEISPRASAPRDESAMSPVTLADESWHTEENVQAEIVTWLASHGWQILSVANTATREHGIDVVASRGDEAVGVEVKGYPSRGYADPARAGEAKRTSPSTQASHWYGQALLAAMRLRGKQPDIHSVIALPDFPRYRALYAETKTPLDAARITIWWVDSLKAITVDGLDPITRDFPKTETPR